MSTASHEETPLLGSESVVGVGHVDAHRRRVIAASFAMVLLVDFAAFFLDAPQTSILEGVICDRYYDSVSSTPALLRDCTVGAVQAELATINQLLNTFNRLPGLFVAIPFGIVADRYGRRPVLVLTFLGALLQDAVSKAVLWRPDLFAPRLIWLSSLASFVGGGDAVASSMVFLVVADVASPQQRASLFFFLTAFERIGEILGTPLSALLMFTWTPWVPYLLYSALTCFAFTVPLLLLPETLRRPLPETEADTQTETEAPVSDTNANETPSGFLPPNVFTKFRPLLNHNVIAVLLAFFVSALGRQSTSFLLQYIRQRFNWTYEKASVLLTVRAAVNLVLLLVALPALNRLLATRGVSAQVKDLFISRLSVALFAVGSLAIALAPLVSLATLGVVIFALGSGFSPAARSLATTFCHQNEAGLLYTALAIAQTVGGLTAGPLLALSFQWGLHLGREWTGIPFAIVAGLFACGFLAISFVRL
ncbi:Major facilitator superfamily domain, general substrate transporter [Niveomyces insectorum RCEF 264]|uniref:Major facilitator superfamily domain, general substrate transporter n=1 Tax=Niveomyces insectorum RCEF 264 TaxID=1081102 RepID=A0A167YU74_9HYPO|nr:Major facilitator superfamily domain, general substrate transporter [Niveomyces insectorum RCEF 264]